MTTKRKPYVRPMTSTWWKKLPFYRFYMLREGTELLVVGDEETISQAFNAEVRNHCVFLPHIVSRKKQIVPMLSMLWG